MSGRGIFISGTDTGVGKTHVSVALLRALRAGGLSAAGFKPVASGCAATAQGWRNDDALALQSAGSSHADYATINPYALRDAIAPHLAAFAMGISIELAAINAAYAKLSAETAHVVVEGAGGWRVPLSDSLMQAHIPRGLGLPVILVVGLRLGCINHALLSASAIEADGCRLLGWIANTLEPDMPQAAANIATLEQRLPAPLLAVVPHNADTAVNVACMSGVLRHWLGGRE